MAALACSRTRMQIAVLQEGDMRRAEPGEAGTLGIEPQGKTQRRIANGAGDDDGLLCLRMEPRHHPPGRHRAERGDGDGEGARGAYRVATKQRRAIGGAVLAETARERCQRRLVHAWRHREGEQHAERIRALGGKVGKVHPQRLAGDRGRRVVGEEMHAGNQRVLGQHQVVARRRRDHRGIVQ
jgi:hypothetical protein